MNSWFIRPVNRPHARIRLFCFPYAGGSASVYAGWEKLLPHYVELYAIQAPGRANRIAEDPYQHMSTMVEALHHHIVDLLDKPYVFYGHSLGSRVAMELMHRLRERHQPLPVHFIASGSRSPDKKIRESDFHRLGDAEFIERVQSLEGTPKEILADRELLELFLPLLRADFKIAGEYLYQGQDNFDTRLTVFGGENDKGVSQEDLKDWQRHFNSAGRVKQFPGGHFFIQSAQQDVLHEVKNILNNEEQLLHHAAI